LGMILLPINQFPNLLVWEVIGQCLPVLFST
jgi:hypothetical protein